MGYTPSAGKASYEDAYTTWKKELERILNYE